MPKMPLSWHRQCLKNQKDNYSRVVQKNLRALEIAQSDERKLRLSIEILEEQIIRAELMGKDAFDKERFGLSKKEVSE
jgi:hypothetical protein